jgi:hypothetical protein
MFNEAVLRFQSPAQSAVTAIACALSLSSCGGGDSAVMTKPETTPKAYSVPGTGQVTCFNASALVLCPPRGQDFYGQDASKPGPALSYRANGDGTVTDLVTGLTWTRAIYSKRDWMSAITSASTITLGGNNDWRVPTVKELYTLMNFNGHFAPSAAASTPFIDTKAFDFSYATETAGAGSAPGERFLDVQLWSATKYVSTTMAGDATIFGVNFADGRIKGYPQFVPGTGGSVPMQMGVRFVRGKAYGGNDLLDNGDGTVSDRASGLVWQSVDDGTPKNWKSALQYCANLRLAGAEDWRLPSAKELHTIIDYTRSPSTSGTAALAPPLKSSIVESYYWTSNTLLDGPDDVKATKAAYFSFGRSLGWMELPPGSGTKQLIDVHGAGAQRTDPKEGDPARFPQGFGPQGDDVRINNFVRCVRGDRS